MTSEYLLIFVDTHTHKKSTETHESRCHLTGLENSIFRAFDYNMATDFSTLKFPFLANISSHQCFDNCDLRVKTHTVACSEGKRRDLQT